MSDRAAGMVVHAFLELGLDGDELDDRARSGHLRVDPDGRRLRLEGLGFALGTEEKVCLEMGQSLRASWHEQGIPATVAVLSVCCPDPGELGNLVFERGSDACYAVAPGWNSNSTLDRARVLVEASRSLGGADVVLTTQNGEIGPQGVFGSTVAGLLDAELVSGVYRIEEVHGKTLRVMARRGSTEEEIEVETPVVLTLSDDYWSEPLIDPVFLLQARSKATEELHVRGEHLRGDVLEPRTIDVRRARTDCRMIEGDAVGDLARELLAVVTDALEEGSSLRGRDPLDRAT